MRKVLSFLLIIFLLTHVSVVGAQESLIAPMPPSDNRIPFLGQDHFYSVVLRGNGEAVVTMKANFSNDTSEDLSQLTFIIPGADAQEVVAYQVIRDKQCARWRSSVLERTTLDTQATGDEALRRRDPNCLEWKDPNYFEYFYGNNQYIKSEVSTKGEAVTVTLPTSIEPTKTGSIVLYYRGMGYAHKTWAGGYTFKFETAKVNTAIKNMQIGMSTDPDWIMSGVDSSIDYGANAKLTLDAAIAPQETGGRANAQFDQIYQQIGYGSLVKSASDLQPNESYTVTGAYAKDSLQLYATNIVVGTIIVLLFIAVIISALGITLRRMKQASTSGKKLAVTPRDFVVALATGFGSAILMVVYTIFLLVALYLLSSRAGYYGNFFDIAPFIVIALMLVSAAIYLFLFIVPAIVIGAKRGLWTGVITSLVTIIWLVIFLVIGIGGYLLVSIVNPPQGYFNKALFKGGVMMDTAVQSAPASPGMAEPLHILEAPAIEPMVNDMMMNSGTTEVTKGAPASPSSVSSTSEATFEILPAP